MKKSLRIILVAMLLLFPVVAVAASFTVSAPRQVIKGRQFQVTYTLENAEGSNIKAADIPGAKLLFGPSESSSYSMSIINGKREQKSTVEYTYTYRAEKEGKYNIKGATINVGGKAISSQGFTIEILPPDKNADNSGNSRGSVHIDDISSQSADRDVSANDVFVRIILSKPSVYEQEATVCTIKLYTKYQISQFAPTLQPSFNGFLIEDLPIKSQINDIENVNGQNYMVAELKRCILYPQQSGKLTITSGNYDLTV
ncbi:MAG: BatD family protein, partial [Muribaculaceae bacterium]